MKIVNIASTLIFILHKILVKEGLKKYQPIV